MKSVFMLFMLPLADQGENLQEFTSFCRTIIEVQEISGNPQFKAWKSPHLIWSPLFLVGILEGLRAFCALSRCTASKVSRTILGTRKKGVGRSFKVKY